MDTSVVAPSSVSSFVDRTFSQIEKLKSQLVIEFGTKAPPGGKFCY
jgi:hypothetical protein